jgi:hypothetical protein
VVAVALEATGLAEWPRGGSMRSSRRDTLQEPR